MGSFYYELMTGFNLWKIYGLIMLATFAVIGIGQRRRAGMYVVDDFNSSQVMLWSMMAAGFFAVLLISESTDTIIMLIDNCFGQTISSAGRVVLLPIMILSLVGGFWLLIYGIYNICAMIKTSVLLDEISKIEIEQKRQQRKTRDR